MDPILESIVLKEDRAQLRNLPTDRLIDMLHQKETELARLREERDRYREWAAGTMSTCATGGCGECLRCEARAALECSENRPATRNADEGPE